MRAGWDQLGGRAWREAWRGRADNPLLKRWRLGAGRALQRQPWWGRNPALLLLSAAVSAGATYLLLLLLHDFFIVRHSAVASRAFMLGLVQSGVTILAWAGLGMSLAWLLGRVYNLAVFALALLGQGRSQDGALRDAALQSSALSDEQVVLAAVWHAWRMVSAPVLALCASMAVVYGLALAQPGAAALGWEALLLAALFFAVTVAGAYTGAACLVLLLTVLGRGLGPLAPGIGAAQIALLQALLAVTAAASAVHGSEEILPGVPQAAVAGAGLLLCATLAWLAHCLRPLRAAAVYVPVVLLALDFSLVAWTLAPDPSAISGLAGVFPEAWIDLIFITALVPAPGCFQLGSALGQQAAAVGDTGAYLLQSCLSLAAQCLLAMVLALLARSAVRRYRGGQP
jgi:hypothetical protein